MIPSDAPWDAPVWTDRDEAEAARQEHHDLLATEHDFEYVLDDEGWDW